MGLYCFLVAIDIDTILPGVLMLALLNLALDTVILKKRAREIA